MSAMPKPQELTSEGKPTVGNKMTIPMSHWRTWKINSIKPIHLSNINTDHCWTFSMKTRADEFVRFYPESLSVVLYGTYPNPTQPPVGAADTENGAANHALRSKQDLPPLFIPPSVMGAGFVSRVEVLINGVKVGTNDSIGSGLQYYTSYSRTFQSDTETVYIAKNTDLTNTGPDTKCRAMMEGVKPFDYNTWNATTGTRIPVYLNGIFPFDSKNGTRASIEESKAEAMYFPPDTEFTIKIFLNGSKAQSIFDLGRTTMVNYFNDAAVGGVSNYVLTFQDVNLSYQSVTLKPAEHLSAIAKLSKETLVYNYDIPKFQYQTMAPNTSYTENRFQILPKASVVYIAFLKSWQLQYMPATRKPVSPFSRFPAHCTNLWAEYAGSPVCLDEMIDFGQTPTTSQEITIYNYFRYLKERNIYPGTFDDMFPSTVGVNSYVQVLVGDLSPLSSGNRSEHLTVSCRFSGAVNSPTETFIVVLTVHPNGLATCKSGFWDFKEVAGGG